MPKRGAEHQLTSDSRSDDEDEIIETGTGFRKADEKTLASRPIKGMPKRGLGLTPSAGPTPSTPIPQLKFAGFGTTTSTPPAFSFPKSSEPTLSAFGAAAAKPPTAANTTLASIIAAHPTPPATPTENGDSDALFRYFSQLRGLNTSVTDACKKALQADPFTDLSQIFTQYSTHRAGIEKTRPKDTKAATTSFNTPIAVTATAPPKPPTVPTSFSFGSTTFTPGSGAKPAAPAGPLSFPSFAPPPASTPSAPTTTAATAPTLGLSSDHPSSPPKPPPTSTSAFSFGPPADGAKSAFSFGSKPPSLPFTLTPMTTTSSDGTAKPSSLFGATTATSAFGNTANPASPFGKSALFGSNTTSTTASSPTKLNFGPPATTSSFPAPTSSFTATTPSFGGLGNAVGFSFGSGSPATTPATEPKTQGEGSSQATSSAVDGVAEHSGLVIEPSLYDKEGPGEEDEETTYSARVKVYKLEKKAEGSLEWQDKGVGYLRCKKHKETDVRRVLMRNSGIGHVQLNFTVFKSLQPKLEKNVVAFNIVEKDGPVGVRLRLKNAAEAKELHEALLKEVEAASK